MSIKAGVIKKEFEIYGDQVAKVLKGKGVTLYKGIYGDDNTQWHEGTNCDRPDKNRAGVVLYVITNTTPCLVLRVDYPDTPPPAQGYGRRGFCAF